MTARLSVSCLLLLLPARGRPSLLLSHSLCLCVSVSLRERVRGEKRNTQIANDDKDIAVSRMRMRTSDASCCCPEMDPIHGSSHQPFDAAPAAAAVPAAATVHHHHHHRGSHSDVRRASAAAAMPAAAASDKLAKMRLTVKRVNENRSWTVCSPGQPFLSDSKSSLSHVSCTSSASTSRAAAGQQSVSPPSPCSSSSDEESEESDDRSSDSESEGSDSSDWSDRSCSCSCSSSHSSRSSSPCPRTTTSSSSSSTLAMSNSRIRDAAAASSSAPAAAVEEIQRLRRYRIPVTRTESLPVHADAKATLSKCCSPFRSSRTPSSQQVPDKSQLVGERRAPATAITTMTMTTAPAVTKSCSSPNRNQVRSNSSSSSSSSRISCTSSLQDVKPVISTSLAVARNVTRNQIQLLPALHPQTPKPQQAPAATIPQQPQPQQRQHQSQSQQQSQLPQQLLQQKSHTPDRRCPTVMPKAPATAAALVPALALDRAMDQERKVDATRETGLPSPASMAASKSALPPEERQRLRSYRIPHLRTPRPERSKSRTDGEDSNPSPSPVAVPSPVAPVVVASKVPTTVPKVAALPVACTAAAAVTAVTPVVSIPKPVVAVKQVPHVVSPAAASAAKSVSTSTATRMVPKLVVPQQQSLSSFSSPGRSCHISSPQVPDVIHVQIKSPPVSREKPKNASSTTTMTTTTTTKSAAATMTTDLAAMGRMTATPSPKSGAQMSPGVYRVQQHHQDHRIPGTTSASTMTEVPAATTATTMNSTSARLSGYPVPQDIFPRRSSPDIVNRMDRKCSPAPSSGSSSSFLSSPSCLRSTKAAASIAAKLMHMPSPSSSSTHKAVVVDVCRLIESVTSQVSELRLQSCRSSSQPSSAAHLMSPHVVNDIFKHRDYLMNAKREHKIMTSKPSPQISKHQQPQQQQSQPQSHGSGSSSSNSSSSRGSPSHRKQLTPPVPLITREMMPSDPVDGISPVPSVNPVEVFVTEETSDFCTHENKKNSSNNTSMRKRRINRTGWDRVKKKKSSTSSTSSSPNQLVSKASSSCKHSRSGSSSSGSRDREQRKSKSEASSSDRVVLREERQEQERSAGAGAGEGGEVVQANSSRSSTAAAIMSPDPLLPVPCTPEEQASKGLSDDADATSPVTAALVDGKKRKKRKILKARRISRRKMTAETGTERPVAAAAPAAAEAIEPAAAPVVTKKRKKPPSSVKQTKPHPASSSLTPAPSSVRTEENDCDPAPSINITKPSTKVDKVKVKKVRRSSIFKPPVKQYLKSGLLSDDYKVDLPETSSSGNATIPDPQAHQAAASLPSSDASDLNDTTGDSEDMTPAVVVRAGADRKPLLGPPAYCSNDIRGKFIDFLLPYDIYVYMQAKKETTASGCNNPVAKTYKKVKQNAFGDVKPASNIDPQPCMCSYPKEEEAKGCSSDCINRMMYVECDPDICPSRERCSNQRMQKHDWSPGLQRFLTTNRGWGVRTTEKIAEGVFILEYIGEVVSHRLFRDRMSTMYKDDPHHYCLNLDSRTVIDGYRIANEGRFVNHSCEPNCEMQKWSCNGYYRVGLFSLRDIEPGEELSYDYNFDNYNSEHQQVCHCGSSRCRGVIGGRKKSGNNSERRTSTDSVISGTAPVQPPKKKRKKSAIVKGTTVAAADVAAIAALVVPPDADEKLVLKTELPPILSSSIDDVIEQVIKMETEADDVQENKDCQSMDQQESHVSCNALIEPKIESADSLAAESNGMMADDKSEVKINCSTINHSPRKRLLNRLLGEGVAEANPSS